MRIQDKVRCCVWCLLSIAPTFTQGHTRLPLSLRAKAWEEGERAYCRAQKPRRRVEMAPCALEYGNGEGGGDEEGGGEEARSMCVCVLCVPLATHEISLLAHPFCSSGYPQLFFSLCLLLEPAGVKRRLLSSFPQCWRSHTRRRSRECRYLQGACIRAPRNLQDIFSCLWCVHVHEWQPACLHT